MSQLYDRIFNNLVDSIDWVEASQNSYQNFHAKGLTYVNLLRNERMTVKLYIFNRCKPNKQGHLIYPHNHGYNFYHHTTFGCITNHMFQTNAGADWDLYTYQTPLNGGKGLSKTIQCGLSDPKDYELKAGFGYYLDHKEIHTISVQTPYAGAILIQFHDVSPGSPTLMFVPEDEKPDCDTDLYVRMDVGMAKKTIDHYRNTVGA